MRLSKKGINKNLEKEIFEMLYQLIADLKKPEEVKIFLEDALGKNGLVALAKRVAIAYYLNHKRSYSDIRENLKVSSATISAVDRLRKSKGFSLAIQKIEADKWASLWSKRIENLFKRKN